MEPAIAAPTDIRAGRFRTGSQEPVITENSGRTPKPRFYQLILAETGALIDSPSYHGYWEENHGYWEENSAGQFSAPKAAPPVRRFVLGWKT